MKRNLLVLLFATASASMSACATDFPNTYSAEPIEAKVIDADTKAPLEGVIVTANWALISGNPGGSTPAGQLMVLETTTDKNGIFRFPGWGPLKRRQGLLLIDDPQLLLFKSGYDYQRLNNYRDGVPLEGLWKAPVRTSQWSGKTIEIEPVKGTADAYVRAFKSFNDALESVVAREPKDCSWKKTPNTIRAMNRERKKLVTNGANPNTLASVDERLIRNDKYFVNAGLCGSPKEFFKDLQQ